MKLNEFFRGAMKFAMAIVIAVIVLFVLGWCGWKLLDIKKNAAAQQYENIKPWLVDLQEYLQLTLRARTKLVNNQMLGEVIIEGYPQYFTDPILKSKNSDASFILLFQDKDGFKVLSKTIPIRDFSKVVNARGIPNGLSYEFENFTSVEDYARISQLSVQWTLETVIPPKVVATKPIELKEGDHCAPNLSKSERLKRLANLGALRQTGEGSYESGGHEITFFTYDNSLLYCR